MFAGDGDARWQGSVFAQVQEFYRRTRQQQQESFGTLSSSLPEVPGLLAILRGYQSQAVAWMLGREGVRGEEGEGEGEGTSLHLLWIKLPVTLPTPVYFNPYTTRWGQ